MPVTVGRLSLPGPQKPTLTRTGLSHSGVIHDLSQAETNARTRQILGLKEEGILPIIWTPGEWDGFYRVTDASVDVEYLTSARSAVRYNLQADLIARAANFESVLSGAEVVDVHGVTGGQWWHVGSSLEDVSFNPERAPISYATRTGVDGADQIATWTSGHVPWTRWQRSPSDWYRNACRVEVGGYTVTGTDAPDEPMNWLMTNQLIRIQPDTFGRLSVDVWSGGAWQTKVFLVRPSSSALTGWRSVRIIENSPARAAIRLVGWTSSGSQTVVVDVALRRGAVHAVVNVQLNSTMPQQLKMGVSGGEAATAITGAIRATANDANGNRYILSTPVAFTSDLASGAVTTTTTATRATFYVGYEVAGTAATTGNTATNIVTHMYYHTGETVNAVPP